MQTLTIIRRKHCSGNVSKCIAALGDSVNCSEKSVKCRSTPLQVQHRQKAHLPCVDHNTATYPSDDYYNSSFITSSNIRASFYTNQHNFNQQSIRSYSSRARQAKKPKEDPFKVLGLKGPNPNDEGDAVLKYVTVKRKFLQIAMKHHPDTCDASNPTEVAKHRDIFLTARAAFELIVEGKNGIAILRSESDKHQDDDDDDSDFATWFQNETGHSMPYMDAATMKEVAEMTETVGGGLDRDGGMWTLARMVTESVRSGGDGKNILQLEAGSIRDRAVDGILRRRKRK